MLGQNIRRLRTMRQISQKALADALGFSYQNISKWENDTSMPDIPTVIALSRYFGISTDVLLGNTPECRELAFEAELNTTGEFSLWTDYPYGGTMSADSYYFPGRHRSAIEKPQAAGAHHDAIVIGVDREGHICLILRRHARGADWDFYDRPYASAACIVPAPGHDSNWRKTAQYELIIPEGGFLLAANLRDYRVKQILEFIIPKKYHDFLDPTNHSYRDFRSTTDGRSLFHGALARGELDYVTVSLRENSIVFSKPGEFVDPLVENIDGLTDLIKERFELSLRDMRNKLASLEARLEEIEDYDCRLCDLESRVEELE